MDAFRAYCARDDAWVLETAGQHSGLLHDVVESVIASPHVGYEETCRWIASTAPETGVVSNEMGETPMEALARCGQRYALKLLVPIVPTEVTLSTIHTLLRSDRLPLAKHLLQSLSDTDARQPGFTNVIHTALRCRALPIYFYMFRRFKKLLDDYDESRLLPLDWAFVNEDYEALDLFVRACRMRQMGPGGWTVLHMAMRYGIPEARFTDLCRTVRKYNGTRAVSVFRDSNGQSAWDLVDSLHHKSYRDIMCRFFETRSSSSASAKISGDASETETEIESDASECELMSN